MKKILMLPLLSISSGHHQVADALAEYIRNLDQTHICEKRDILQYSYGSLETAVSGFYLKWIGLSPGTYSWIYRRSLCLGKTGQKQHKIYEFLFERKFTLLIREINPDLLVCTHSLPSYLVGRLKRRGLLRTPAVNAYTDFFINELWNMDEIDVHLAPDEVVQESLLRRGVPQKRIFVTGIPTHPQIRELKLRTAKTSPPFTVILAGGNLGMGAILPFLRQAADCEHLHFKVLCGKNRSLFAELSQLGNSRITPLPYIDSKEEMDRLYNEADAVVTKPGGVTVSECLRKRLPVFIYYTLPGQEEMNLRHLQSMGLIFSLEGWNEDERIGERIIDILTSQDQMDRWRHKLEAYRGRLQEQNLPAALLHVIEKLGEAR